MDIERFAPFLDTILVVELGQRLGAGICGSLMAELGANIVAIEMQDTALQSDRQFGPVRYRSKSAARTSLAAGKQCVMFNPASKDDQELIAGLVQRADVVIISNDCDPPWPAPIAVALDGARIRCDVTAFGNSGPNAGHGYADPLIQAVAGSMDTSGEPDGPPALCEGPIIEMSAAIYAASGAMAALRVARQHAIAQAVEVSLYDCAVGMLATFLPRNFAGGAARRIGNHHPGMSPWNAYNAKDGWVLLCAGTNDQWKRVCGEIGRPDLVEAPGFSSTSERVANNVEVDAVIDPWVAAHSIEECVDLLNAISISTGPILTVADLESEPNLAHRGMIRTLTDTQSGQQVRVPGSPLRGSVARGTCAQCVPAIDAGREAAMRIVTMPIDKKPLLEAIAATKPMGALTGVKVIEMGQFTTAPLVGRQLGALGADVVKLEPANGEAAREMPPHKSSQGLFFTLSNSDKRVMNLDLRQPGRKELLAELIGKADILVENTKPGTLARHGFTPEEIVRINPRIVYCAISGFGIDAPYAGLGAMDTTIQGLAGIMDLTRVGGVPYKTGMSIADLHAGQFALLATLAALEHRDQTGRGQYIDLAMLDAAAWVTRTAWNDDRAENAARRPDFMPLASSDGYVLTAATAADGQAVNLAALEDMGRKTPREVLVAWLNAQGIAAAPVRSVKDVIDHEQTRQRGLIFSARSAVGEDWNLLGCPIRLSETPAHVSRVIGALDCDRDEILRDWQIAWRAPEDQ